MCETAVPRFRRRKTEAEPQIVAETPARKARDFPHIERQSPYNYFDDFTAYG